MDVTPSMAAEAQVDEDIDDSTQPPSPSDGITADKAPFTPREAALFLMKTKEIHKVSQSSLQG